MTLELDGPMVDDVGEGDLSNCRHFYDAWLKFLTEVSSSMTVEEIQLLPIPFILTNMVLLHFPFHCQLLSRKGMVSLF